MKTAQKRVFSGVGIVMISLAMVFSALSCDNGGGDKEKEPYTPRPELPEFLVFTFWNYGTHALADSQLGESIVPHSSFSNTEGPHITITFYSEEEQKRISQRFELKKVVYAEDVDMYSLLFDDDVTKNNVAVREKKVTMVNFECIEVKYRNGPWVQRYLNL